jgi:hypothetical protein
MERDGNCGIRGIFNISACKFGAPMAISWPHFLHGDPKLLEDVEGLNPDINRHGFFLDFQPVRVVFSNRLVHFDNYVLIFLCFCFHRN